MICFKYRSANRHYWHTPRPQTPLLALLLHPSPYQSRSRLQKWFHSLISTMPIYCVRLKCPCCFEGRRDKREGCQGITGCGRKLEENPRRHGENKQTQHRFNPRPFQL
ncbi:unnamed protein product [Pleuronectes platessa]|uniref:Uncharacterized protein n=1 Tax=Pleuronectes platessa TaxID=8262 RepID=A0A9N7ZBC1_PLEPL|nr:unnamed protein product [Pleuronectes platessa]